MPFIEVDGHHLEYEWLGKQAGPGPCVVMLHEGLGSVSRWGDFPAAVADATGLPVLVYSRLGYGKSDPLPDFSLPVHYMHDDATKAVPGVLAALGIRQPILFGHSDGASVALIYAGSECAPAPLGVVAMSPHVFVEPICTVSIAKVRVAYEEGDVRERLARHHDNVDSAFYGWNLAWLLPGFKDWNIEDYLPRIRCPIFVIQGDNDEYGTMKQVETIERLAGAGAEHVLLEDCGHSPQRQQRAATLEAAAGFITRIADQAATK
ncbi:MAG: alpha/beta fold hydrolase [Alphaproteobacteria bacterium]